MKKTFKLTEVFTQAAKKLSNFSTPHPNPLPDGARGKGNITSPLLGEVCFQLEIPFPPSAGRAKVRKQGEGFKLHNWWKCLRHCEHQIDLCELQSLSYHELLPTPSLPNKGGGKELHSNANNSLAAWLPSYLAAFTLAEVLITLGVIGVVAAITIPTLIQNHKKKEYSTRLKKFYSTMSQAIVRSEIDNGPVKSWTKTAQLKDEEGNYIRENNRNATLSFFNQYLKPYLIYTRIDENPTDLQNDDGQSLYIRVYFPDSTYMNAKNGACTDLFIDINGEKQPNTLGRDIFAFVLCAETDSAGENRALFECGKDTYWCSYGKRNYTRKQALQNCKNNTASCATLIMMDGWEFKDDYPYRL